MGFTGRVSHRGLGPFQRLRFARFILGHPLAGDLQILADEEAILSHMKLRHLL